MRRSVLVVEDDPGTRQLLATILDLEDFEVVAVGSGEEALDAVSDREPDVMVLDIGLPGVDGIEVCRQVKARSRSVSVILLTGLVDAEEAEGSGYDEYLSKPFSPLKLLETVTAVQAV